MRRLLLVAMLIAVGCVPLWPGRAEASCRFVGYTQKAAKGKKIKPVAATYWGGKNIEEFVAVGGQPDGTVVALGNAYGPDFPAEPKATVLGEGEWYDVNEFTTGDAVTIVDDQDKPTPLDRRYPNKAGAIVRYSADLQKIVGVTRFNWGVAGIESGLVAADGGIIIHGFATPHFPALGKQAPEYHEVEQPDDPRAGKSTYQSITVAGDVYVARLSPDAQKIEWAWLLKGHREAGKIFFGKDGDIVFRSFGFKRISADGTTLTEIPLTHGGRLRFLATSPKDGLMIRGGDANTGTGHEPWRKPLFYGYDRDGKFVWSIYDWSPGLVGHADFRLVSDSSVRAATFDPEGNIIFYGWSDGGNTVFGWNPIDPQKSAGKNGFGMSLWGAGVGSFCHVVKFRPSDFEVLGWTVWVAYLMPDDKTGKDQPNGLRVEELLGLSDGSIAMSGGAGTWLVQTPDPWFKHPKFDNAPYTSGGRGNFVAVFSTDFSHLYFSSAVPGCTVEALGETPRGVLFAGTSVGKDKEERPNASPVLNAAQKDLGGGRQDAWILMLEKPLGAAGVEE